MLGGRLPLFEGLHMGRLESRRRSIITANGSNARRESLRVHSMATPRRSALYTSHAMFIAGCVGSSVHPVDACQADSAPTAGPRHWSLG